MLVFSLIFIFLLGLCVGSFLNVVAHRMPLGVSLVTPPSRCPSCQTRLWARDNVPVLGWLWLRGRCRHCRAPISPRYPIVEGLTGLAFLLVAGGIFVLGWGPCVDPGGPRFDMLGLPVAAALPAIETHWPILVLYLTLVSGLLAASLIDIDTFTIPMSICVLMQVVGLVGHALLPRGTVGALHLSAEWVMPAAGALVGLLAAIVLLRLGVLPVSFPQGEPMLADQAAWQAEIDAARAEGREPNVPAQPPVAWTRGRLNLEIGKELLFLSLPVVGALAGWLLGGAWPGLGEALAANALSAGLLGAALGGMASAAAIWAARILGTLGFGKVAMGLGDVHLMAGVGAITGPLVGALAIFPAAVVGLVFALYGFVTRSTREVPFGPYLAIGTLINLLAACAIVHRLPW